MTQVFVVCNKQLFHVYYTFIVPEAAGTINVGQVWGERVEQLLLLVGLLPTPSCGRSGRQAQDSPAHQVPQRLPGAKAEKLQLRWS